MSPGPERAVPRRPGTRGQRGSAAGGGAQLPASQLWHDAPAPALGPGRCYRHAAVGLALFLALFRARALCPCGGA